MGNIKSVLDWVEMSGRECYCSAYTAKQLSPRSVIIKVRIALVLGLVTVLLDDDGSEYVILHEFDMVKLTELVEAALIVNDAESYVPTAVSPLIVADRL